MVQGPPIGLMYIAICSITRLNSRVIDSVTSFLLDFMEVAVRIQSIADLSVSLLPPECNPASQMD